MHNRRDFIKKTGLATALLGLGWSKLAFSVSSGVPLYQISLAEWSVNKLLFSDQMDHLDFPLLAKKHGIHAVEYVNQFFMDKAKNNNYLKEMKNRADGEGVKSVLIMCDNEGRLGAADANERKETVENHKKWVDAAKFLGCHAIRVNGYTSVDWSPDPEDFEESMKLVADGLHRLCEYADNLDVSVIIENHGGYSSNGKWLAGVMRKAEHARAGTLPDFGNFRIGASEDQKPISYDSYKGVAELMPYAKGVSVKTTAWDDHGNQSALDYEKMMGIVLEAGYHSYCGIEYGEAGREWESIVEVRDKLIETEAALQKTFSV